MPRRLPEAAAIGVPGVPDVPLVPVPDELPDRAADSWEVLLGIAEAAGGTWPVRARAAAIALSADEDVTASEGMRLLREAFGDEDHLTTAELLRRLHDPADTDVPLPQAQTLFGPQYAIDDDAG